MPFMKPHAVYVDMLHVETTHGTELVLAHHVSENPTHDAVAEFCEGEPEEDTEIERAIGWYARYTAHGYMDCTQWIGPRDTNRKALESLATLYGVCERCHETCWEGKQPC